MHTRRMQYILRNFILFFYKNMTRFYKNSRNIYRQLLQINTLCGFSQIIIKLFVKVKAISRSLTDKLQCRDFLQCCIYFFVVLSIFLSARTGFPRLPMKPQSIEEYIVTIDLGQ